MKIMHFIAASAIMLGAASAARAADVITEEPTPEYMPPAFSWTGAYLGAQVGYGWGKSKGEFDTGFETEIKPDGWLGGLYGGYNWEAGDGFVVGAEVDFNYADLKKEKDYYTNGGILAFTNEAKLRWEGAVRGRVGYAVDRFLPYLAGGVAFGEFEQNAHYVGLQGFKEKKTRTGWTVGAGVDYAATDNVILRLEYRYVDFGKKDFDYNDTGYETDFKSHEIRLGVAYKF